MSGSSTGEHGEFSWEIIEFARSHGCDVANHDLKYWHEKGAIPAPTVVQHPSGRGRTGVFPVGTAAQVVALRKLLDQRLDLAQASWRLWVDGYPVAESCGLGRILAVADQYDATLKMVRERAFEPSGQAFSDEALAFFETKGRSYDPRFRLLRKAVGGDRLATLFFWILGFSRGQEIPPPKPTPTSPEEKALSYDYTVIIHGLGLQEIHRHKALMLEPIPKADIFKNLNKIAIRHRNLVLAAEVTKLPESYLRAVAREVYGLATTSGALVQIFSWLFGRHAFGRGQFVRLFTRYRDDDIIMLIALWSVFRGDFTREQVAVDVLPRADFAGDAIERSDQLQKFLEANPALAAIWTREAIRSALAKSASDEEFTARMRFLVPQRLINLLKFRIQQLPADAASEQ